MSARRMAVAVALSALAGACAVGPRTPPPPVLSIGGDFSLTDHDGHRFELSALRGKVVVVFFGYASCPDACPTTLSKLATVSSRLGADRSRVKTLYVSVDPARDTPAVLKADLSAFDLDAIGLTGTKPEIDRVVKQYGAAYEIVPAPESAMKYTVSHTTTLYALDGRGRPRLLFRYEASVDEIVRGIRSILAAPDADVLS